MVQAKLWSKQEDDLLIAGLKVPGRTRKACERRSARLREKGVMVGKTPTSNNFVNVTKASMTSETTDDSTIITLPSTRIHTIEGLVELCKIDINVWAVERFVCNKWDMGAIVDGEPVVEELYQVKAWFKRRLPVATEKIIDDLKADAKNHTPSYTALKRDKVKSKKLLEVSIFDHHFGKMAWHEETGTDYDLDIAVDLFEKAIDSLIVKASGEEYASILFPIGNDVMQFDNLQGTTTSGTKVDTDSRYPKVFRTVRRMLVKAIDKLSVLAPVQVIVVPGNHDKVSSFCLGDSLECWYHDNEDVKIDNAAVIRKYYEWGNCLIGFTHGYGSREKPKDLPLIMAAETPQAWGRTKYREWHIGHLHMERVTELCGIKTRILPSLCATDAWHKENGFVENQRSAQAFVWNFDKGLEAVLSFNL